MENSIKQTKFEVYFTEESGLHNLSILNEKIVRVEIGNGFLKILDAESEGWHCYNLNFVKHFHYPC